MKQLIAIAVLVVAALCVVSAAHNEDKRLQKNREQPAWCHDAEHIERSGLCKNVGREYKA
jgi:hypothetical protein